MAYDFLILGAGRSAGSLIDYLGKWTAKNQKSMCVADLSLEAAQEKSKDFEHCITIKIEANNELQLEKLIAQSTIVISLLPPPLHPVVAKFCLKHFKHMATASYASPEIMKFHEEAKQKGLTFLFELGVDPGIDHMSSLKLIHKAKQDGGQIQSFKSFSGALMSLSSENDNPWQYKFTWNPRNVVLVGQGAMAQYRVNNSNYFVPYQRLFKETWNVEIPSFGNYEAYANRNSLQYNDHYGLNDVPFLVRGTLRRPGFCEAWNALIRLGATNNQTYIHVPQKSTIKDFFSQLLRNGNELSDKQSFENLIGSAISNSAWDKIQYLDLLSNKSLSSGDYTPADVLELVLLDKWNLENKDTDMVLMYHELTYLKNGKNITLKSHLAIEGKSGYQTAISSTVGLPLAIGVKLLFNNKIKETGVVLPVKESMYNPILEELKDYGIEFKD